MQLRTAILGLVIALSFATSLCAQVIKHDFIAIDEGFGNLLRVDENNPSHNWIVKIGHTHPRDMQVIGADRVLIGHENGYTEFEIATGKIVKELTSYTGVASARRQANGNTLLVGVNLAGNTGIVILDLNAKDEVQGKTVLPGNYVRLMRQTARNTWLMVCDTKIREVDATGSVVADVVIDGFKHAWKALRLPNGNTLASAGYGGFMVELDPKWTVVRKFGAKGSIPAELNPNFFATFQLLQNGNVVVANWQGHGPGHGKSGKQILEFDKTGAAVWNWSNADIISSIQAVLVLDGLDTGKLCDERNGIMESTAQPGSK